MAYKVRGVLRIVQMRRGSVAASLVAVHAGRWVRAGTVRPAADHRPQRRASRRYLHARLI